MSDMGEKYNFYTAFVNIDDVEYSLAKIYGTEHCESLVLGSWPEERFPDFARATMSAMREKPFDQVRPDLQIHRAAAVVDTNLGHFPDLPGLL